jgi:hypothetical protein
VIVGSFIAVVASARSRLVQVRGICGAFFRQPWTWLVVTNFVASPTAIFASVFGVMSGEGLPGDIRIVLFPVGAFLVWASAKTSKRLDQAEQLELENLQLRRELERLKRNT